MTGLDNSAEWPRQDNSHTNVLPILRRLSCEVRCTNKQMCRAGQGTPTGDSHTKVLRVLRQLSCEMPEIVQCTNVPRGIQTYKFGIT